MDRSLKGIRLPIDSFTFILSAVSMIAAVVVFIFTTFQTKSEAIKDQQGQSEKIDRVNETLKQLHDDLGDVRKEVNAKLDRIIRDTK